MIYPKALFHNISRCHYIPGAGEREGLTAFLPIFFRVMIYPPATILADATIYPGAGREERG
jgi:hypothetical protein